MNSRIVRCSGKPGPFDWEKNWGFMNYLYRFKLSIYVLIPPFLNAPCRLKSNVCTCWPLIRNVHLQTQRILIRLSNSSGQYKSIILIAITFVHEVEKRMIPDPNNFEFLGAYQPNWFMKYQHVHPGEAVEIHKDIRQAKFSSW